MAKLYFSVLTISMLTIVFVMIGVTQLHDKWGNSAHLEEPPEVSGGVRYYP